MAREEARRAIAAALGHRLLESYESNREAGPTGWTRGDGAACT